MTKVIRKKSSKKSRPTLEERQGRYEKHLCDARIWMEKPRSGGLGLDNFQCSSKKVHGCFCKKHFKMQEEGQQAVGSTSAGDALWTGLITEPRPENPVIKRGGPGRTLMAKIWSTDADGNERTAPWPMRGQGKVTRGWTKIVDHTAYMGQAEGFQGLCPPDWALELAMSCNTLEPKSKINPGLSTAAREVLHSWAEPLIKEADEYGGYITAKRPTRVECWIRVQTRNPNDLLSALTPEKGSVVYISPGASIDLIRNSGYACVWSDDDSAFWGDMHLIGVQSDELD
jgi:hypothetical protein